MHAVALKEPVNTKSIFGTLQAGTWIMTDLNAFEIGRMARRGSITVDSFSDVSWVDDATEPEAGKPMLVMREGAIGDLLLLMPALAALKARISPRPLALCCFPRHFEMFAGNKSIDELVPYPLSAKALEKYSSIVSLENTMESNHSSHATDVFAKALDVKVTDHKPTYVCFDEEKEAVKTHLFTGRPNLAIHMHASVANRNYPLPLWLEVIENLEKSGWGILLFGRPAQVPPLPPKQNSPFIRNLTTENLTFRQSAAILAQCQAFVGVDSGLIHLCHAFDIPAVGLYAAFDWRTRTGMAPKTFAITGRGDCAPCSWHMHAGKMFPPDKTCSRIQQCTVLAEIPPKRIVDRVNLLKP